MTTSTTYQSLNKVFTATAGSFAEQVVCFQHPEQVMYNAFGRQVEVSTAFNLSELLGLASSGIRSSALLTADNLFNQRDVLTSFARLHIPITVVVPHDALGYLASLSQTGAVIFYATGAEELKDLMLNAQVISEKALVPVVVIAKMGDQEKFESLNNKDIAHWMGDPDGRVPDPSKAQTMLFGAVRRRIPAWMLNDNPAFIGAQKSHRSWGLEKAAVQAYEQNPLQTIIDETIEHYNRQFQKSLSTDRVVGSKRMKNIIILPPLSESSWSEIIALRELDKENITLLATNQLYPVALPSSFSSKNADRVLVLEPFAYQGTQGFWFKEWSAKEEFEGAKKQNGWFVDEPNAAQIKACISNLMAKKEAKREFWLDVPFSRKETDLPKFKLMLEELGRQYPEVEQLSLNTEASDVQPNLTPIPAAIRKYANGGPTYARLSRFHDHSTVWFTAGEDHGVADPFQVVPTMPVASAAFVQPENTSNQLPQFNAKNCTGCLDCLSACPHSALPAKAFDIESLIKKGMDLAKAQGMTIRAMTPILKTWSKLANEQALVKVGKATQPKDILTDAFEATLKTVKDEEKLAMLKEEYVGVMNALSGVQFSLSENLFVKQHKAKPGSGLLFTMALEADACTSCGYCIAACDDDALSMQEATKQTRHDLKRGFDLFTSLTDTSSAAIEQLQSDKTLDPINALLLDTSLYQALIGASQNEAFASEKIALKMVLASAEIELRQRTKDFEASLGKHATAIKSNIKKQLNDALPTKNLDALMHVLNDQKNDRLSMDHLFSEWGKMESFKSADKLVLERQLSLIDGLNALRETLKVGVTGVGRSPYSIVLDASMSDFASYPSNYFSVPVLFAESGKSASMALGAMKGSLRHALDNIRLVRRAELEATGKYNATQHDREIADLSWEDLTAEEKQLLPPVLLVGKHEMLASESMHQLMQSDLPIKIVALDNGIISPDNAMTEIARNANAFWPYLVSGKNPVIRTSVADSVHLYQSWKKALSVSDGAIISVFAPSAPALSVRPEHWMKTCGLALRSRVLLPFAFLPESNSSFTANMDVQVPSIANNWIKETSDDGAQYEVTWADWAFLMTEWKRYFTPIEKDEKQCSVAEFLNLNEKERASQTPVIFRMNAKEEEVWYAVDQLVIDACEEVRSNFRTLREWSGLFTEHPEKLKAQVLKELSVQFEKDKQQLEAEYVNEKQAWEAEYLQRVKQQVKDRLMQMAGHS